MCVVYFTHKCVLATVGMLLSCFFPSLHAIKAIKMNRITQFFISSVQYLKKLLFFFQYSKSNTYDIIHTEPKCQIKLGFRQQNLDQNLQTSNECKKRRNHSSESVLELGVQSNLPSTDISLTNLVHT